MSVPHDPSGALVRVHLLAQLLGVGQGGSQHAGHLAGQEGIQCGAQGQPGVQEHAAAGAVMDLQSRTRLSSACSMLNTQHARSRTKGAPEAAKIHSHAQDAAGERLRFFHITAVRRDSAHYATFHPAQCASQSMPVDTAAEQQTGQALNLHLSDAAITAASHLTTSCREETQAGSTATYLEP